DWHVRLIVDWIQNNPPGKGTGWEPYPTSLRIVNWIKWALAGNELPDEALQSLAVQTRWLSKRLEWHLLGNHLLANAKALVFAGLFDGSEAVSWQRTGLSIYRREIPEQVLADGGHFERSPMYHAIILEDLLDLFNLSTAAGAAHSPDYGFLAPAIERMRCWLSVMTHRDGGPGFFNDCAFGIAPGREDLEQYATRLGLHAGPDKGSKVHPLLPSGYVRVNSADLSAILDVAPIGPDYLPGHAHADTLSFEISLGEDRVIVNGGTSVYGTSAQRQFERSTAAHSTVEVDGENSSEIWGGFRVARRARVIGPEINTSGAAIDISAEHDGYKRLGGNAAHRRVWRFESGKFVVEDKIGGRFKSAIARFHMGPMAHLTINEGGLSGEISLPLGRKMIWSTSEPAHIESSTWHPEFGKSVETKTLVVAIPTGLLETTFIW
ncbi:MAG: heparinase, partial [Gammaproteobacteria bacterium]|nr:heparinase [Gammaproteobacteria bacterium]